MKKYFMPENNATYLKDKDASKCSPFTGIKNKQKTYAHQKVSAVCSMHSYLNFFVMLECDRWSHNTKNIIY